MINATKKWIFLKISGATLVPLMIWFIINFISIYDQAYFVIINFFTNPYQSFYLVYSLLMLIFFQH